MKRPTLFNGIYFAFAASLLGAPLAYFLMQVLYWPTALRVLPALLALFYVGYLLTRTPVKTGRIAVTAIFIAGVTAGMLIPLPPVTYLLLLTGMIWLVRSLYFHSSPGAALVDMGVSFGGLISAYWALSVTGSFFVTIWCFFLTEALFVLIPQDFSRESSPKAQAVAAKTGNNSFERAHRAAEEAFRRLVAHQ